MSASPAGPEGDLYDYIIIGAGSAGSIIAARLSEDPALRVLLIEAGGSDRSPWFDIPGGYARHYFNPATNWMYHTEPQPGMADRRIYTPRGKVQGGSGSINAMIWLRGQRRDFDDWRDAGNPGWGYEDLLPWFQRLEDHPSGPSGGRGKGGPIGITPLRGLTHPLCDAFLAAAREAGLPETPDFNGPDFEGAGIYETNIARGRRQSSSKRLLSPALRRPNLSLRLKSEVLRITRDPASGRASGVVLRGERGEERLTARREIILSAGAIGSPKLLLLSGIGDGAALHALGISPWAHLPAVGAHLQDHLCASFYYRASVPSLNERLRPWWGQALAGMEYLLRRRGPLAISVNQAGGFFRSHPDLAGPDLQLYFNPMSYRIPRSTRARLQPEPYPGFLLAFNACRPKSEGQISLASPDPLAAPRIDPAYLSHPDDQREVIAASQLIRRLMQAPALQAVTEGEVSPGPEIQSEEAFLRYFREEGGSIYHLCGSCRMGPDPRTSVVGADLRVHGVPGLRVADASVFPNITSGNINAPVMMLAEKAAALIAGPG